MDGPPRFGSLPNGSSVNREKLLALSTVKSTGPARCDKHARRTEWRKRHLPEGDARLRGKGHQQRERQAERDALAELHRLQATLGSDFVRGFQAYPAVQEYVKIRPNGQPVSSWILIRTNDPQRVASEIKKVPGIEGLIGTVGNFDLLARFGAEQQDALMQTVLRKIQTISGVKATETLPAFSTQF